MKNILKYGFLAIAVMFLVGCGKQATIDDGEKNIVSFNKKEYNIIDVRRRGISQKDAHVLIKEVIKLDNEDNEFYHMTKFFE